MIVSSIDIGSNTILLLVTEINISTQAIKPLRDVHRVPRISKGLMEGKNISESQAQELFKVLSEYNLIINSYENASTLVTATNVFRIASNAQLITDQIKRNYNWDVMVLSGDEEARLSFLGATFPFLDHKYKTIIDIGGGSTEIICGNENTITFQNSFYVGAVSLTEKFFRYNPPAKEEIILAENYIKSAFIPVKEVIPKHIETIAVAGTPTALSCIKHKIKNFNNDLIDNSELTFNDIKIIIKQISKLDSESILKEYGSVVEGREDVLLAGSLILLEIMNTFRLGKIKVSTKGLRYGVIVDYMKNNKS